MVLCGHGTLLWDCSILLMRKHRRLVGLPRLRSITGRQVSEADWFPLGFKGAGRWQKSLRAPTAQSWDDFRDSYTF